MIRVLFGSPRCGKTTTACKLLKKNAKRYEFCFANFTVSPKVGIKCDLEGLGEWTFPLHSYVVIDEAGIEYNNRGFKTLPKKTIEWFKLHGHYKCDVDVFSQSWEDMDITIRRLADELWYMKKIGPFTIMRKVYKTVSVDDNTHQIIDAYRLTKGIWLVLQPLRLLGLSFFLPQLKSWRLCFRPFYYRYFNSWEVPPTPVKTFGANNDLHKGKARRSIGRSLKKVVVRVLIKLNACRKQNRPLNAFKRPK